MNITQRKQNIEQQLMDSIELLKKELAEMTQKRDGLSSEVLLLNQSKTGNLVFLEDFEKACLSLKSFVATELVVSIKDSVSASVAHIKELNKLAQEYHKYITRLHKEIEQAKQIIADEYKNLEGMKKEVVRETALIIEQKNDLDIYKGRLTKEIAQKGLTTKIIL